MTQVTPESALPTDAQLAALVTACAYQLSERAQVRELRTPTAAKTVLSKPDTLQMIFVN